MSAILHYTLYSPTVSILKENNRNVDKKNLAKEVQTTRPILDIYFGEFTYSLALSDSHVNCPSSGDNTKPLAKI